MSPPAQFRPKPFWLWNIVPDELTPARIREAISDMAAHGLGGFVVFNKPPMGFNSETYLGPEWMELVRVAAEYGASLGLEVWINDGFDFPPCAIADRWEEVCPESAPRQIVVQEIEIQGPATIHEAVSEDDFLAGVVWQDGDWENRQLLSVKDGFVCVETGSGLHHLRIFTSRKVPVAFPTLRNPATSEAFINYTYKRYEDTLGPLLGKEIKGMFSDADGMERYDHPYYDGMFEELGEEFVLQLPALFEDLPGHEETCREYRDFLSDRYGSWFEANYKWCKDHGLLYTYHSSDTGPFSRDSSKRPFCIRSSNYTEGRYQSVNQHADYPGTDHELEALSGNLHFGFSFGEEPEPWPLRTAIVGEGITCATPEGPWPNQTFGDLRAKQASSLAHTRNRKGAMCEQFAAINWGLSFKTLRKLACWQISQGITFLIPHAHFESLAGLRRQFAPPSHGQGTMLWRHYNAFTDWTGRATYLASRGTHIADIALIEPSQSLWSGNSDSSTAYFVANDWLTHSPFDFDVLDEQAINESTIENGCMCLNAEKYKVIVIPALSVLDDTTRAQLQAFRTNGGTVISLGESVVDGDQTISMETVQRGMDERRQIPAKNQLSKAISSYIEPDVVICRLNIHERTLTAGVHFLHRTLGDNDIYMFFNLEEEPANFAVVIRAIGNPEELDLETGTISPYPSVIEGDRLRLDMSLELCECRAFIINPGTPVARIDVSSAYSCVWESVGPDSVNILEPNWLPIHLWNEGDTSKTPHDLTESGEVSITLTESIKEIEVLIPNELAEKLTAFRINGIQADISCKTTVFESPYRTITLSDLPAGELELAFDLCEPLAEPIMYTPVYLRGHFRVFVNPGERTDLLLHHDEYYNRTYLHPGQQFKISGERSCLRLEAWEHQGYPFYSGTMEYDFTLDISDRLSNPKAILDLGDVREVAEVILDGKTLDLCPWTPYRINLPEDLCAGKHDLTIRVTNTSANIFEEAPQQSGLLMPVRVFGSWKKD